jgi:hypothetical protein
MARPPKCCGCVYCDWMKMTCKFYPEKIPVDIQLQDKKCEHYILRIDDDDDDDLPLAKGR